MTADEIQRMTDEEVSEDVRIGLRCLIGCLLALPERKRLELIWPAYVKSFDCVNEDPEAIERLTGIRFEDR